MSDTSDSESRTASIMSRRRFLATTSTGAAAGLAGCSGDGGGAGAGTDQSSTPTSTSMPGFAARKCDSPESLSPSNFEAGGTISKGCYRAKNTLEVQSGTLTLEAGVQIEFEKNVGVEVGAEGGLHAKGTASDPVVLTGTNDTRGHWKGLFFNGSDSNDNRLKRTLIQYAGGGSWNPNWKNGAVDLRHGSALALDRSLLRENGRAGLVVWGGGDTLSMSNTRLEANEYPARVHSNVAGALTPDNRFTGNDTDAIRLGVDGSDTVSTEQTWQDPGVPFQVNKHIELEAPVTVTEGATFIFDQKRGLNVRSDGRLNVEGTSDALVTFTGREELRSSWKGIRFGTSKGTENSVNHAVVEFAGDSDWNVNHKPAGMFLQGDNVSVNIENTTFRGNASMGLIATGADAFVSLSKCRFTQNEAPLLLQANLVGRVDANNSFDRNQSSYVYLDDPGTGGAWTPVTERASWPALSAPYRPKVNLNVEAPLEISPGAAFEFEQDHGMRIRGDGRLMADASDSDPITFGGVEDISGFWKGLYFVNSLSSDNVLQNIVIANGGSSEWVGGPAPDRANLMVQGNGSAAAVEIGDSTISGSGKYGIAIGDGEARVMGCDGLSFENNSGADTYNIETKAPISSCQ